MSRITNIVAQDVAMRLTESKRAEITAIENQINEKAFEIHKRTIPASLLKEFDKHPSFFNKRKSMQLSGPGLNYQTVQLPVYLPTTGHLMFVDEDDAVLFVGLFNKISDKKRTVEELTNNIAVSLINLRTYKNIEASFPEAYKLLPVPTATKALAIDLSYLRTQLT